jgi:predicted amidohydrolase
VRLPAVWLLRPSRKEEAIVDKLKLALVQMQSRPSDVSGNVERACAYIDDAAGMGASLIVVPEFFNTEYFYQYRDYKYLDYAEPEDGPSITAMRKKAVEHRSAVCATILEEQGPGVYFDTAFLIDEEGSIVGKYRKTHPAAVRSLEKIYFRGGARYPVVRLLGWNVGMIICYDHFFPEAARCAAVNGAELILGPFAAPSEPVWESLMRTRAWENGCYISPCNKVGIEGEWRFGGESMIVSPYGEVLARAGTDGDEIVVTELDRDVVFAARRRYPMLRDRRPEVYQPLCSSDEQARGLV